MAVRIPIQPVQVGVRTDEPSQIRGIIPGAVVVESRAVFDLAGELTAGRGKSRAEDRGPVRVVGQGLDHLSVGVGKAYGGTKVVLGDVKEALPFRGDPPLGDLLSVHVVVEDLRGGAVLDFKLVVGKEVERGRAVEAIRGSTKLINYGYPRIGHGCRIVLFH